MATAEIKSRIYRYGVQTDDHRLMVRFKCTRASTNGQSHIIRKCARAYDQIAQFTDEQHEHIIDQARFHEHI
eukprot:5206013-Pyramimonas_sp.AAC.1